MSNKQKQNVHKEQHVLLLFEGYIRRMERLLVSQQSVPPEIVRICVQYYPLYIAYSGAFIKDNVPDTITVINPHLIELGRDAYKSAKLDTAIKMNHVAVYRWKMALSHTKPWSENLDNCDFIGVVSDRCDNIGRAPWGSLIDCYGISGVAPYVYLGTSDKFQKDTKFETTLINKQIVIIELDCDAEEITFKLEEDQSNESERVIYGPLKLPKRDAWYPAVSLTFGKYS
eukprot:CAMPEP_0197043782 /NCGR_PEP_ID=MMETSP1384-20130603/19979_1 /TAXON_ID=29189 /ORGANISM="Ammonia sp." /LENGTH=227 /DNA_ID=CAMNT_0042475133 /DNA_START=28 /DNA_END=707 /DNA_ORIENTATION=-